ncbi:MAG: hypothetical protein AAF655_12080 [Bacteroidota bacterium]
MIDQSTIDAIQAYSLDESPRIYEESYLGSEVPDGIIRENVKDQRMLKAGGSTEMLQPFQEDFTPKGQAVLSARKLETDLVKIDLKDVPRKYHARNYHAYMKSSGNNPYDFPYAAYVVNKVIQRFYHDIAKKVRWAGVKAAVVAGVAGAAADSSDGFLKKMDDSINVDGDISPIITGTFSNTDAVLKLEAFVDAALSSVELAEEEWNLYCSQILVNKYIRSYQSEHGTKLHVNKWGHLGIEGKNAKLVPQEGIGEDQIVMAKPGNLAELSDGPPSLLVERHERAWKILVDGVVGFQYAQPSEIFVNEQVDTTP